MKKIKFAKKIQRLFLFEGIDLKEGVARTSEHQKKNIRKAIKKSN
jgi:hypothetical protein